MSIPYHRWPDDLAARYREKGYWLDVPMTDILARHENSDAIAVIEGDLQLSYRQLRSAAITLPPRYSAAD